MALPKFEKDISYISKLSDQPNDTSGGQLSAAQLKERFDAAGNDIKTFLNDVLIPAIASDISAAAEGVGGGSAIGADKLADGAVTAPKIAALAVLTSALADLAVTTAKLADGAVTSAKIADGAVNAAKIARGAVVKDAIADEAVSNSKIFPGAVTADKLHADSVTADKILNGAVSKAFSATVEAGWDGAAAPYTKEVSVSGLTDDDVPIIDFIAAEDFATAQAQSEAWGNVYRAVALANTLKLYSKEQISVDIPIQVRVVRK